MGSSTNASPGRRKIHVHAECGEPVKGHHRLNGALVCRSIDGHTARRSTTSEVIGDRAAVPWATSKLQSGKVDELESAMMRSLQLLREAKAYDFSSQGIPGVLYEDSVPPRRDLSRGHPTWAEVAAIALDTFRELWKHTVAILVLLLCIAAYLTRSESSRPSPTCNPS